MSKAAIRNRKALPTRFDIRAELSSRELAAEYRDEARAWGNYLIETGRVYQ